jgi:hypothetical protein
VCGSIANQGPTLTRAGPPLTIRLVIIWPWLIGTASRGCRATRLWRRALNYRRRHGWSATLRRARDLAFRPRGSRREEGADERNKTDRQDFGDLEGVWVAGHFDLRRLKYFNQLSYCSMFRREMCEAIGGYRVNVSGFADWDFWVAAASRGFRGHHLPGPLLQHRRHRNSHLARIMGDYERLYANIILNNREVYSETEIDAANRFLSIGERVAFLRLGKLIFAQSYPLP